MKEYKNFKKIFFPAKTALGEALFLLQNFDKHLKQKRCTIRCLNVLNFCYLKKKKSGYHGEKRKKLLEIHNFPHKLNNL